MVKVMLNYVIFSTLTSILVLWTAVTPQSLGLSVIIEEFIKEIINSETWLI